MIDNKFKIYHLKENKNEFSQSFRWLLGIIIYRSIFVAHGYLGGDTDRYILKAFRFSENLADLFFLLLRHKFSSIAHVTVVNFNAEKRKKKEQKIRKPKCFEYNFNILSI
jgi:hypothetical protein